MSRLPALVLALSSLTALAAQPPALNCPAPKASPTVPEDRGNPKSRQAAQRGLEFLARSAQAWQDQHQCYGCHVHSVTLEALSVGVHNQYDVPMQTVGKLAEGMLRLAGGARGPQGLSYSGGSLSAPSKAFGGAAIARYDQWVDSKMRDDLVIVAGQLLQFQQPDGKVVVSYENGPSSTGDIQGTYQAIQTWKQAHARTADNKWLAPVQKAEHWLQSVVTGWKGRPDAQTAHLNYALMGLVAAGIGSGEPPVLFLTRELLERQTSDGGWALTRGGTASALPTGQTLYALRLVGLTERDGAVAKGTSWLSKHQLPSGGWSAAGFGKAEAMWGVLGLVSVDVMTVSVAGLTEGGHVEGVPAVQVEAKDNQSGGVTRVALFVDDLKVQEACGAKLSFGWDTRSLSTGKHIVDAVATNAKGQVSRRRLEVFSGNVFLTQVGTQFVGNASQVTARDIAPEGRKHQVELNVLKAELKDGKPVPGAKVFGTAQAGATGPVTFSFGGKANGRYFAELLVKDPEGKVLQREEVLFNHATAEAERADYAQVQGKLMLGAGAGAGAAANTQVDLLDEDGRVVQSTVSTAEGQYRFKNVDSGKYKVRAAKKGYAFDDVAVKAEKAQEAAAPMVAH
ncbi:MAG: carboxypeptidase regulatory-like domain-containing protein [Myxococcaceae bacterium]